ncbi:MAG: hypothetical protein JNM84_25710 [Planctomycetes bacterium]|nr:hypothetical protein [Planctomycetota bacterium]
MTDRSSRGLALGLFLISAATLCLQILQTRIFSVLLWHHVTYIVVTLTLLGFTIAGAVLTVLPGLLAPQRLAGTLTASALLFAATTIGAFHLVAGQSFDSSVMLTDKWTYFLIGAYYAYLVVPYFFAGLAITAALSARAADVGRLYFVNLIGSAVGCWLLVGLLTTLRGEGMIFFCAALGAVSALAFAPSMLTRGLSAAAILACAVGTWQGESWLPIPTAPDKLGAKIAGAVVPGAKEPLRLLASEWSPLCRVDVWGAEDSPLYVVAQDGDAPTTMRRADLAAQEEHLLTPYALGYRLFDGRAKRPEVLIIGPGGGPDIVQALRNDAGSITGVEINAVTAGLMRGPFKEYTGGLYEKEKVAVHVAEGRSFLRRSERQYDLIQMTGTDTYTALSSGAYVLSESYLYTREAFHDYFDHLSDDGVVAVLRFRFDPPREDLRLFGIGLEVLKERGAERPSDHAIVIENEVLYPYAGLQGSGVQIVKYAVLLFKKRPFTAEQVAVYCEYIAQHGRRFLETGGAEGAYLVGYMPERHRRAWVEAHVSVVESLRQGFRGFLDAVTQKLRERLRDKLSPEEQQLIGHVQKAAQQYADGGGDLSKLDEFLRRGEHTMVYPDRRDEVFAPTPEFQELATAIEAGTQQSFYDSYPYLVSPVSDDQPFFFKFHRWSSLWGANVSRPGYEAIYGGEPIGLFVLLALLLETSVVVALLVLLPLLFVRRKELKERGAPRRFLYFAALGVGFILVEVSYLQGFVLFLGHPLYSLTVTLSSFLFFAGLGAWCSGKFRAGPTLVRFAVLGIAAMLVLYAFLLPEVFRACLALPDTQRILLAIALLSPLNFLMGIPFPTGIRLVEARAPRFIPWAFGVNGGASVVGSILCIILAISLGFQAVALLAAAIYVVGGLVFASGEARDAA